jgi:shikimate kinase
MPERHIILTGFMGSGKSSVGRVLADKMSCQLVDLDSEIVSTSGRSINDIFAQDGEQSFRSMETDSLKRVLQAGRSVIATGGGAVIADENRALMRSCGIVVNLAASLPYVLKRLQGATDRPLFDSNDAENRMKSLMEERKQFYADADIRIDTDGKSVEDVAAEILRYVKGLRT